MRKSVIIQKTWALVLLFVFTISVTPKHLFHDLLTTHTDQPVCQDEDRSVPHFHHPVFHCSFDDLTLTSPFLVFEAHREMQTPAFVVAVSECFLPSFYTRAVLHAESRGPPSI